MNFEHTCNAYCGRDGLHCELIYANEAATADMLWQTLGFHYGLKIDRAEPAREPFPWQQANEVLVAGRAPATKPWLVWFR